MTKSIDQLPTDEESCAFEELCDRNGIDMSKSTSNRFAIKKLEMFFDGYSKIVGLHYFPFLAEVAIIGQNISKIDNLTGLHHLKEFWLADCRISVMENLNDLTNLEKLYLQGNRIKRIDNLSNLRMLQVLWLARNNITMIENLSHLHQLKELNLAENRIESVGRGLEANSHLEILNLSGNPIVSFKELNNLSKLSHLRSLSLRDPTYKSAPVAENVNYSTQVLFYLPNLDYLDSNEIRSRPMQEIATSTVLKKKSFYDTRLNGMERTVDAVHAKLVQTGNTMAEQIKKNLRMLVLSKKELVCYMQHETPSDAMPYLKHHGMEGSRNSSSKHHDEERCIACRPCEVSVTFSVDPESSRSGSAGMNLDALCYTKLVQIDSAILRMERMLFDLDDSKQEISVELERIKKLWKSFLRIELETAGNVFFEFGNEKDPWFNHCRQLLTSRFYAADYSDYGISQVNVLGVVRISNRHQRTQFDMKLESAIVDKHEHLWQLTMLEIARRANIEYLFYVPGEEETETKKKNKRNSDEEIADVLDYLTAVEHGFRRLQQDPKNGIVLTNNLFWADRRRFPSGRIHGISPPLNGRLRFGQALLCKVFCGNCQLVESDANRITADMIPNCDSVLRSCAVTSEFEQPAKSLNCPDCQNRIQEWFLFDHERILPEYIVFYEYDSLRLPTNPFTTFIGAAFAQSQSSSLKLSLQSLVTNAYAIESDADVVAMEPVFSLKIPLNGEDVLTKVISQTYSEKITRLCLYNCSLTHMPPLKLFPNLSDLDLSLNRIKSFPEARELGMALHSLENIQLAFNDFTSFEGSLSFARMRILNINWNHLSDLNLVLGQLRRQMPFLNEIHGKHNPWFRPKSLRCRFVAAFKSLQLIDESPVTDEEKAAAAKLVASASLSNAEAAGPLLIAQGRTDYSLPGSVALGPGCYQILSTSSMKPKPYAELQNISWMENITALVLENQGLTKLAGIDRLKFLKWASFRNNFITSLHGIESCHALVELLLDNNCITSLDPLTGLLHTATLSLNNNRLTSLEFPSPDNLQALANLSVNGNLIQSPNGTQYLPCLQNLFLANNSIENIREIFVLKNAESLFSLDLFANAVCHGNNYRLSVVYHLPNLKILDSLPIETSESNSARDFFGGKLSEDFVLDRLGLGPGADLSRIAELDLPSCNLFSIDIPPLSLPNLRSLNLENNNLSNVGSLANSQSLQVLCLNNNHIESLLPSPKGRPQAYGTKSKVDTGLVNQNYVTLGDTESSPILPCLEVLYLAGNAIRSLVALQIGRVPSLVSLFLHNNEISSVEGIDFLTNLRDLVLDRNRIKAINENSFMGQGRLVELHMEENRLRDLSFFNHLRNLRRLYLGGNKLQMASELEKLQDLRKLHEISLVNNPLTRKNIHRAVILYYLPQLHLIDGMPITEEDTLKAQMLANQDESQGAMMGGAALMPTTMGNYTVAVNPNSAGILPVHVYQPIGLPLQQQALTTVGTQPVSGLNASNAMIYYQTSFHQPITPTTSGQQAANVLGSYIVQSNFQQQQQASSTPQVKVSNLQLGLAKPSMEDLVQSQPTTSTNSYTLSYTQMGSATTLSPITDAWNVSRTLPSQVTTSLNKTLVDNIARRLRLATGSQTSVLQQMNSKQQFIPSETLGSTSQQQQDAVTKIHGNKLTRH